jgi:hypothetical protein
MGGGETGSGSYVRWCTRVLTLDTGILLFVSEVGAGF